MASSSSFSISLLSLPLSSLPEYASHSINVMQNFPRQVNYQKLLGGLESFRWVWKVFIGFGKKIKL